METHSPFRNTETLENKEKMSESESITEAGQSFAESLGVADQVEFFDGTKLLITPCPRQRCDRGPPKLSLHTRLKGEVIIVKDRRLFGLGKMGYLLPELPQ